MGDEDYSEDGYSDEGGSEEYSVDLELSDPEPVQEISEPERVKRMEERENCKRNGDEDTSRIASGRSGAQRKIEPSFPKEPILSQEEEEFRRAIREKCKNVRRANPRHSARRKQNQLSPKSTDQLMQENAKLRAELRRMNETLDEHIRRSRANARARVKSIQGGESETKKIHKLYKDIDYYQKANQYLKRQITQLSDGQTDSYSDISLQLRKKTELISKLKKELKTLNRKLDRPRTPVFDPDREMQLMAEVHKAREEARMVNRKHAKHLEKIRALEKNNREKHLEICALREKAAKYQKEVKFRGGSPKKMKGKLQASEKRVAQLEKHLVLAEKKYSKLETLKKRLQKLTFRQNREIENCKERNEIQEERIAELEKTLTRREAFIARKFGKGKSAKKALLRQPRSSLSSLHRHTSVDSIDHIQHEEKSPEKMDKAKSPVQQEFESKIKEPPCIQETEPDHMVSKSKVTSNITDEKAQPENRDEINKEPALKEEISVEKGNDSISEEISERSGTSSRRSSVATSERKKRSLIRKSGPSILRAKTPIEGEQVTAPVRQEKENRPAHDSESEDDMEDLDDLSLSDFSD